MLRNAHRLLITSILIILLFAGTARAQWALDFRKQMEIPDIITVESSETHLYVLSDSEGLVVFRAYPDSLQWLYSSTGMQQRGSKLDTDIRFAYLYGDSRRLTVVEPTSVLGVYSSTVLPAVPRSVKRVNSNIYIALGENGLGSLSLESPESVDSELTYIDRDRFRNSSILDVVTDKNRTLYVLSSGDIIDIYSIDDDEAVSHTDRVQLNRSISRLFLTKDELLGTDQNGNIYLISSGGETDIISSVSGPVQKAQIWNDQLIARTESGEVWIGPLEDPLTLWKSNSSAGNHFTVTENQFWIAEFDNLSPVIQSSNQSLAGGSSQNQIGRLKLKPIDDIVLPFPRSLLLPIELEEAPSDAEITYSFQAPFNNARIRGNSLYWQPTASQSGRHQVEIIASSSDGQESTTEFIIDLRTFNSPPRFSPSRPVTIPTGESFQFTINAVDPDGVNSNLIRYLGVDMPEGARLNEKTGVFTWTPSIRQVGNHKFRVIATDQYGAAASQEFEITVVEINEQDTPEPENS